MKAIITLILFTVLLGGAFAAGTQQQRFEQANALFRQKQYTEAAGIYQQLINEGYQQPELFVNAGNAYYKANRTGAAIYNYEKALRLDPGNKSATHNLNIAKQRVEGYVEELPLLFFQRWWIGLLHLHSPNGWAIGSIVCCWLLIAAVIAMLLAPDFKPRLLRWGTTVIGAGFAFYLFMGVASFANTRNHDSGIVMGASVKAKSAPDQHSKDMFELHEGMKVEVTDATQEYCKIQLPDGKTGWVTCAEVKRL